ncbi:MAG: PQQ-binding-like beta-propeller repeat protein [Phycisphaerales bacterium]|jgi:outer membrane protein assembly factor BamB|nr:PQQ-binding-like beta-propeller repeat protein [Phycisphaerales bacterium]
MKLSNIGIVALITAFMSTAAQAGDWGDWGGGPTRNMASVEKNIPTSFGPGKSKDDSRQIDPSTTRNVKWSLVLGSQTYGNPVIAGGKIIVGTNDGMLRDKRFKRTRGGLVICCDAETGKTLWRLVVPRFRTKDRKFNYDNLNLGICNSAAIQGDRAYIVSSRGEVLCLDMNGQADGNDGEFQDEGKYMVEAGKPPAKLNKTDADIIWRYDMIAELPMNPQDASSCAVIVDGDFVYAGTSNGVDRGHNKCKYPDAPSIIVLNRKTGKLLAQDNEKTSRNILHGQWSSPALITAGGKKLLVYGCGDGVLYAFEALTKMPDGDKPEILKVAWKYDCSPKEYRFDKNGKKRPYEKRHASYKSGKRGGGPSEIIATPVFYKGKIYVAIGQDSRHGIGDGALSCIDAATGKRVWISKQVDRTMSTCSILDDLVYVSDYTGNLHCFDAETGQRYWVHETKSPLWSSTFAVDGKVFLGTENSELWVLQTGKKKKVLNKIKLLEKMANTPTVANGVLYIATGRYLYAISAEK